MILANIKWIFFDIGSTLVDESVAYQNRIERTIAGTNVTYDDFYNKMVEISKYNQSGYNKALEAYGLKTVPWNSDDEFVYPETENCLGELSKHYRIGIIANQNLGSEERLEKLGLLKHIDLVIASAEEGVAKPDLRIFQIALARADCKPEEAVMVGDRLDNDIIPANKIGMTTVWIKQGFGSYAEPKTVEEQPDYIVNNLVEITELFR
jgi:HAD superfamily hydrolase (TIGR01662 family)